MRCTLNNDVEQIYSTSGNLVARYIYDTWGNTVSVIDGSGNAITSSSHIAHINPIRYRGYYFDGESGLYYLQSRYYDPVVKRFVNPDGYVYTGQDMQSGNMYAYCGNSPVARSDASGGMYVINDQPSADATKTFFKQMEALNKTKKGNANIKKDIENFSISNTSEQKVLEATYFSAYKGVPVIRTDGNRSGSFGMIF